MSAAGLYKTPISIKKYSISQNEYGEQEETLLETVPTRAWIKNLSNNRESVNNETFYADTKQLVVHNYLSINDFDHIEIDGKEYRILTQVEDKERMNITLNIEIINT